ncbi:MAG TPA: DNA-directed DNA polymerase, partial [archaeon]|nr:DNA-directed DNA polymerase [archaeon]
MKLCILDADYIIEEKPTIRLSCIDEKGESVLILDNSFRPYFYAEYKKGLEAKLKKISIVTGFEKVKKKLGSGEKEFLKIFVDIPQNVPKVRDEIKKFTDCYEYSINFYKRYLIDKKFYPLDWIDVEGNEISKDNYKFHKIIKAKKISKAKGSEPKIKTLAFDIETVDEKIVMISVATEGFSRVITYKDAKNVVVVKNEKEMLLEFEKCINEADPDIIVTYNGDGFDFDFIRNRLNEHRIDIKIGRDDSSFKFAKRAHSETARLFGRLHIDLFQYINNIMAQQLQSEVLTLREVSSELLGETKEELSIEEIINIWEENPSALAEYCKNDSLLTYKLAGLLIPQIFSLSRISGQLPFDCSRLTYGLLVEWFLIRKAGEMGMVAPNNPHWDEIQKRREEKPYKGAFVKEPKVGLHSNIAVFDFRSLYPSIIVTYNISPETLNKKCKKKKKVPESKNFFCADEKGFIPSVLKEIIDKRMRIKSELKNNFSEMLNEQQNALKILANAMYGYMAYSGARFYSKECAEAAAAFGRQNIKKAISMAEKYGFDVIYSDTDSLFVKSSRKEAKKFLEKINESLPGILELELQGIYKKGLFVARQLGHYTAKKRYALLDEKGNMTIRGFEAVRRDWCPFARRLQHKVLFLVLKGREKEAVSRVKEAVKKIKSRKIEINDIAIKTQLGKPLEEYKVSAPHVAVAKKLKAE